MTPNCFRVPAWKNQLSGYKLNGRIPTFVWIIVGTKSFSKFWRNKLPHMKAKLIFIRMKQKQNQKTKIKTYFKGKLDIGWIFGFWFFKKNFSSQWKSAWLSYEVSFISVLGIVSSKSWKRLHPNYYAHHCTAPLHKHAISWKLDFHRKRCVPS